MSGAYDRRVVLYAPRIASPGGIALLCEVVHVLLKHSQKTLLIASEQAVKLIASQDGALSSVNVSILKPRFLGPEFYLRRICSSNDTVICFGNLPPLLKLPAFTCIFVQNRNILPGITRSRVQPWNLKIKDFTQLLMLRLLKRNGDRFVVQSTSMQVALESLVGTSRQIKVEAFAPNTSNCEVKGAPFRFDFIYPATGDWHKNHRTLVEAWVLLSLSSIKPKLALTLDVRRDAELIAWVKERSETHGLEIENLGRVSRPQILEAFSASGALIFPSLSESLGLPLVEAKQLGVPILASELDFVRDMVDPIQTFDPRSSRSIARAVSRSMGIAEHRELVSVESFIKACDVDLNVASVP